MLCEEKDATLEFIEKNYNIINSIKVFDELSQKIDSLLEEELPLLKNKKLLRNLALYSITE